MLNSRMIFPGSPGAPGEPPGIFVLRSDTTRDRKLCDQLILYLRPLVEKLGMELFASDRIPAGRNREQPLEHYCIVPEVTSRLEIGPMPGLGPMPRAERLPAELFRPYLNGARIELPPTIEVLIFRHSDDRLIHLPVHALEQTELVRSGVQVWRDLMNGCVVARTLGAAVFELHRRGWVHQDLSLSNVLVRENQRFFQTVELIDFEHACRITESRAAPAGSRLYWGERRLKAEVDRGTGGQPSSRARPDAGQRRVQDQVALGTILGLLLVGAETIHRETKVNPLERNSRSRDLPLVLKQVALLSERVSDMMLYQQGPKQMREALSHAALLVHPLMTSQEPLDPEWQHQFLSIVDTLRVQVLQSMMDWSSRRPTSSESARFPPWSSDPQVATEVLSGRSDFSTLKVDTLADVLRSFEIYAPWSNELDWCARFRTLRIAPALQKEIGGTPGPASEQGSDPPSDVVSRAVRLLKAGFVRLAEVEIRQVIEGGPSGNTSLDIRALRLLVGIMLLREGRFQAARDALKRFQAARDALKRFRDAPEPLRWWHDLIELRIRHYEGGDRKEILCALKALERPDLGARERAWLMGLQALATLRARPRAEPIPAEQMHELRLALRGADLGPESVFASIQVARCFAHNGDLGVALRYLHVGIAEAASNYLLVEYAMLLLCAAWLTRDAFVASDRERLRAQGLNNLMTVTSLVEVLHEAGGSKGGFELVDAPREDQTEMHRFLVARLNWFIGSRDPLAERLREEDRYGRVQARAHQILDRLIKSTCPDVGSLGWVSIVARKVTRSV